MRFIRPTIFFQSTALLFYNFGWRLKGAFFRRPEHGTLLIGSLQPSQSWKYIERNAEMFIMKSLPIPFPVNVDVESNPSAGPE